MSAVAAAGLAAVVPAAAAAAARPAAAHAAEGTPGRAVASHRAATAAGGTEAWAANVATRTPYAGFGTTAVSPDGKTVYVAGGAGSQTGGLALAAAYNAATGARLWRANFAGAPRDNGDFYSIAVSPDGSTVYVTGDWDSARPRGGGEKNLMVAYAAATGKILWKVTAPGDYNSDKAQMALSSDGTTLFVTGTNYTAAYSTANGAQLWNTSNPKGVTYNALALSPAGTAVFLTGSQYQGFVTEALNPANGATIWQSEHNVDYPDSFPYIGLSQDGSTVFVSAVTAHLSLAHTTFLTTFAYNAATGAQLWVNKSKKLTRNSAVEGLAVDPAGSAVFVAERIWTSTTEDQGYQRIVALNPATGATLWQRVHLAPSGNALDDLAQPSAIAASPDGSTVYVTGTETKLSGSTVHTYMDTIAYQATTGTSLWRALYQRDFEDLSAALAVSPDGSRVFVTGMYEPYPGSASRPTFALTVAYNS